MDIILKTFRRHTNKEKKQLLFSQNIVYFVSRNSFDDDDAKNDDRTEPLHIPQSWQLILHQHSASKKKELKINYLENNFQFSLISGKWFPDG